MQASARRIRLQERRWGLTVRAVLTRWHQAAWNEGSQFVASYRQFHEVIGRWQNLTVGLWLADADFAEAVTLSCACRAAELCTGTAAEEGCDWQACSSSSPGRWV